MKTDSYRKQFLKKIVNVENDTMTPERFMELKYKFIDHITNPHKFTERSLKSRKKEILRKLKGDNFQEFFYSIQTLKVSKSIPIYVRISNWIMNIWNLYFRKKNYLELLLEKAEVIDNAKILTEKDVKERQEKLKEFGIRLTEFKKDDNNSVLGQTKSKGWVIEDYKDPNNYYTLISSKRVENNE